LSLAFAFATGTWYTKPDKEGRWHFHNEVHGPEAVQLRGISMTGFETGTRGTNSGGGYWLYDNDAESVSETLQTVQNVAYTMVNSWGAKIIRMPICGSGWLQNYNVRNWANEQVATYKDWVDNGVNYTTQTLGAVVVLDVHLWAIGDETNLTRDDGMEDGCTGINKVCVGVPSCVDSCAPHDWYGQYYSARTGKTYNQGDDPNNWQCAIANADGCSLDNLKRNNNQEQFLNLWYDLANHYKNNPNVWFEIYNEPYQRQSAQFDDPACVEPEPGTSFMCPPGTGYGDNIPEQNYDWTFWSQLMSSAISTIRGQGANNMIVVSALDWSYDFLGAGGSSTGGPISRPTQLLPWYYSGVQNIAYALHPYQHGACCGQIGSTSDLSANDPYESAFCMYPPSAYPSNSSIPIPASDAGSHECDTTGYTTTQNKKSPPCIWAPNAIMNGTTGVCAGDQNVCSTLNQAQCNAVTANWTSINNGGWTTYVLPMQKYGPLIATEFGPFDCSSPYTNAWLKWARQNTVSYTAWALWPQNSGGPGAGACGYPGVIIPPGGALDDSCGFGKCSPNCLSTSGCAQLLQPAPWSGTQIYNDLKTN